MRRRHSTLNSAVVSAALCQLVVTKLAFADYKESVPADVLARVLLLCGCLHRSASWVASRCRDCPGQETVRKALLANLPGEALLLARLLDALHSVPGRLPDRPLACAIDLHLRPFYGADDTPGTSGGPHEAGTDRFWAYATLVLLCHGRRYTVGLVRVDRQE